MTRRSRYSVRAPLSSDPVHRREGRVVSYHRTREGAERALDRHARACARSGRGGFSDRYVYDVAEEDPCVVCAAYGIETPATRRGCPCSPRLCRECAVGRCTACNPSPAGPPLT